MSGAHVLLVNFDDEVDDQGNLKLRHFTRCRDPDQSPIHSQHIVWGRTELIHTGKVVVDTVDGVGDYTGNKLFSIGAVMRETLIFANYGDKDIKITIFRASALEPGRLSKLTKVGSTWTHACKILSGEKYNQTNFQSDLKSNCISSFCDSR